MLSILLHKAKFYWVATSQKGGSEAHGSHIHILTLQSNENLHFFMPRLPACFGSKVISTHNFALLCTMYLYSLSPEYKRAKVVLIIWIISWSCVVSWLLINIDRSMCPSYYTSHTVHSRNTLLFSHLQNIHILCGYHKRLEDPFNTFSLTAST